jgi:four helix bundle protein
MGMNKSDTKSYQDLEIWKNGMEIVIKLYSKTKSFPKEETYGLIGQIRRAAVSIPSNIAEGFNRRKDREVIRFLHIAYGSCGELKTQMEICPRLGYLSHDDRILLFDRVDHEERMLKKYIEWNELKHN